MWKPTLLGLLGGAMVAIVAAPVHPIAPDVVPDRFRSLGADNQHLAGVLADRIRANTEGLLERIDPKGLLLPYSTLEPTTADSSQSSLAAESAGLYLSASASAYEYRSDSQLRKLMDAVAEGLASAQRPDGYLGAASTVDSSEVGEAEVLQADLLGLLAYYRVTGEERAYSTAQKAGDRLVRLLLSPAKKDLQAARAGLDAKQLTALISPLVELYRYTAETDYLDLAKVIAKAQDAGSERLEPTLSVLQYLTGMAELYRATGTVTYLRTASQAWNSIQHQSNSLTGVPTSPGQAMVSNCVTQAWMDFTLTLFRVTGGPQYGEQLENTIYNQLLASQDVRSGAACAEMPPSGEKHFALINGNATAPCVMAEAAGLTRIPAAIWARWQNGIAINLYTSGRGTFELRRKALVQLYVEANYPQGGDVLVHVEPSRTAHFPLRLRVPEWAESYTADYGGSHMVAKAGDFLLIDREWKRGDTVKISMRMRVQLHDSGGRLSIRRGPELLVLSRNLNPQIQDLLQASIVTDGTHILQLKAVDPQQTRTWAGEEAYQVPGEYHDKAIKLLLVPFADARDFAFTFRQTTLPPEKSE